MWLPRLMRAANEEQVQQADVSTGTERNSFGVPPTCDYGHAASCGQVVPMVSSSTDVAFRQRFTSTKWCCIAFLVLVFFLTVFVGLFTSTWTGFSTNNSFFVLAVVFITLLVLASLCCLLAGTICKYPSIRRENHRFHRTSGHAQTRRLLASFTAEDDYTPCSYAVPSPYCAETSFYDAVMDACAEPLPTYDDAIKKAIFVPPAYSTICAERAASSLENMRNQETLASSENSVPTDDELQHQNMGLNQELSRHEQSQAVTTIASVEVHEPYDSDVSISADNCEE